jgi:hypothetical protein
VVLLECGPSNNFHATVSTKLFFIEISVFGYKAGSRGVSMNSSIDEASSVPSDQIVTMQCSIGNSANLMKEVTNLEIAAILCRYRARARRRPPEEK